MTPVAAAAKGGLYGDITNDHLCSHTVVVEFAIPAQSATSLAPSHPHRSPTSSLQDSLWTPAIRASIVTVPCSLTPSNGASSLPVWRSATGP